MTNISKKNTRYFKVSYEKELNLTNNGGSHKIINKLK